jgi:PTS system mannose-specific IID component
VREIRSGVLLRAFLRSFLIQGSWNYRTMIGNGFGFALMPVLRWLYRDDPDGLARATARHTEHFNAHPYMAGLAIGATARMEADGAAPEAVRRFKSAVRGPLGGLGDRLVWAGLLPCTVLVALVLAVVGADAGVVVVTFLVLYNLGHLTVRGWAFRTGVDAGPGVGSRLAAVDLGGKAERVQGVGVVLLGVLTGLLTARAVSAGGPGWAAAAAGAAMLAVGGKVGLRIWRPMSAVLMVLIVMLTVWGTLT